MAITQVSRDEIFLLFTLQECGSALRALEEVDRLSAIRTERAPGIEVRELGSILSALRLALHHSGSVSRIFWPPRNKDRGDHLRELIKIDPDHPLNSRKLRDNIEHIDERLDDWTENSPRSFTTIETVIYEDYHEKTRRQILDSTLWFYEVSLKKATILGNEFDLNGLKSDLEHVSGLVSEALSEMYRQLKDT